MAQRPKFVTPVGTVKFPSIEKPDAAGKFRICLVLDPKTEEFGKMIAAIDEAEKDFEKKYRGKPHYKQHIDLVDGQKVETEDVLMQFSSAFPLWDEKGTKLFDSKGQPVKTDIGWGSKCRVAFTLLPYEVQGKTGVTRYIAGIQIIDLKLNTTTAEGCGFDAVEGGFEGVRQPYAKVASGEANAVAMTEEEKQRAIEAGEIAWDE